MLPLKQCHPSDGPILAQACHLLAPWQFSRRNNEGESLPGGPIVPHGPNPTSEDAQLRSDNTPLQDLPNHRPTPKNLILLSMVLSNQTTPCAYATGTYLRNTSTRPSATLALVAADSLPRRLTMRVLSTVLIWSSTTCPCLP